MLSLDPKNIAIIKKIMYGHTSKSLERDGESKLVLTLNILNVTVNKKGHTGARIKNPRDKSTFLYFFIQLILT